MRIRDILNEKGGQVVTIDANQSLHEAIDRLNKYGIGALIATTAGNEVVGIITERDILRKCGDHSGLLDKPTAENNIFLSLIRDVMTKKLVIGVLDDDPDYVMGVMTKNRIRHLPIMENGKLAGIVSIGDLVNAHLEEKVFTSRTLKNYISRNDASTQVQNQL